MVEFPFQTWDIFTRKKFTGNPLAVVFDASGLSTDAMQTITAEFNLSETTFVLPPENSENTARVRIFTPEFEMPFAGHPTVGTAIAIGKSRNIEGVLKLELNAGIFPVNVQCGNEKKLNGEDTQDFACFTSPNTPVETGKAPSIKALAQAVGLEVEDIDQDAHHPRRCGSGGVDYIYLCANLDNVKRAKLDYGAFEALELGNIIGLYLYAKGGEEEGASYHARMFAPSAGVPEDPATGSAATAFPAQIALSEKFDDGEYKWIIEQGYEMGRPSQIMARVTIRDGIVQRVQIGGYGVPMMSGVLKL